MNMLEAIHWLDATLVAVGVVGSAVGAWRGVLRQTVRLITYVISFYATLYLHGPAVAFLHKHLKEVATDIPRLHSFLGTMLGVYLVVFAVTLLFQRAFKALFLKPQDREITSALDAVGLRPLDRLLGAGLGLVVAALVSGAALLGLTMQPDSRVEQALAGSQARPHLLKSMQAVLVAVPQQNKDELGRALERLQGVGQDLAEELTSHGTRQATRQIQTATQRLEQTRQAVNTRGSAASTTGKEGSAAQKTNQ